MLTEERYAVILNMLNKQSVVGTECIMVLGRVDTTQNARLTSIFSAFLR